MNIDVNLQPQLLHHLVIQPVQFHFHLCGMVKHDLRRILNINQQLSSYETYEFNSAGVPLISNPVIFNPSVVRNTIYNWRDSSMQMSMLPALLEADFKYQHGLIGGDGNILKGGGFEI